MNTPTPGQQLASAVCARRLAHAGAHVTGFAVDTTPANDPRRPDLIRLEATFIGALTRARAWERHARGRL